MKGLRTEVIHVLETTLDDCSPQVIGYVLERALELGALDAWAQPVQMKKSRPGVEITVLARVRERPALLELLFAETPTLGVRVRECERVVRPREVMAVATRFGDIRVKVVGSRAMPEFEDCQRAARLAGVPLDDVQEAARAGCARQGWNPGVPSPAGPKRVTRRSRARPRARQSKAEKASSV